MALATLVFPCRRCGAPVDAGAKAGLLHASPRVLLDCACVACGHRALYGPSTGPGSGA